MRPALPCLLARGSGGSWAHLAAGGSHSLALKTDGSLWAWGLNDLGQLGDGTAGKVNNRSVPTRIGAASDWQAVAAGDYHSLALKTDGSLWAWGLNHAGQLGDGTQTGRLVPTRIGTDSDWRAVAAGSDHCLALKTDGSLWAWGLNRYGRLGDGTDTVRLVPTRIGTASDWQAVAAGGLSSLALKADGSLWAWGLNHAGQVGDGTQEADRWVPTRIGTASDWQAVAARYLHSLALKTDSSLWAWGWNYYGQLGDGTDSDRRVPTRIGADSVWRAVAPRTLPLPDPEEGRLPVGLGVQLGRPNWGTGLQGE